VSARLSRNDKLLLGLFLPAYAVALALHGYQVADTGLAQLPVFALRVPGEHPVVAGYRLETDSGGSGLEVGDRLIRLGDRDLRDEGYVSFDAIGLARARPGAPAPLWFERDGVRRETQIEARPHPQPWSRVPVLALIAVFCGLLVLRAPGSPSVQRFSLGFGSYGLAQAHFYGGPEWLTGAAAISFTLLAPLSIFLMMRWAVRFPDEMPASARVWWGIPWLAAAIYLVLVRGSYVYGWPVVGPIVPRVSLATHALMIIVGLGVLCWNYAHAHPAGRRRLRWILLGSVFGSAPLVGTLLAPVIAPDWAHFELAFAFGFLATMIWILGFVLAAARDNAFDVDRLLGATTAWATSVAAAAAALLALVRLASAGLSEALGLPRTAVQLSLAGVMGALAVPVALRLRPLIDRVFFPERAALAEGSDALGEALAQCRSVDELLEQLTRRTAELLRAAGSALYVREGARFALARATDMPAPPELAADASVPRRVVPRNAPEALRRAGVLIAVPIARGGRADALVCLGPKQSGDIYTHSDAGLLAALAGRTEALWLRFEKEAAEGESRAKTDLLAAASHDLRQPLHAVGLLAETLAGRLDDPEMRAIAQRIGTSTHDLDEMLSSLLDRSRLDAGAVRPELGRVELCELFDQLERDFAAQARARGLRLRIAPTRLAVRSDRLLLLRILRNLTSNALRYTAKGAVLVAARPRGPEVAIEVRDSGCGIPEAEHAEIFRPFHQRAGADRAGLGLGLSIVDGLAALLGHAIELRSAPERGSCFSVRATRAQAPRALDSRVPALAPAPIGVAAVLVVDDDRAVREATVALLRDWGCDARGVDGLPAALAELCVHGFRPDFVLADFRLRGPHNGIELVAALREAAGGEPLRAALVTGEADPALLEELRANGLPVLAKPARPAQLRALLSSR
jgi:signal transduction histidine kinase